jgi:hypothetical protein
MWPATGTILRAADVTRQGAATTPQPPSARHIARIDIKRTANLLPFCRGSWNDPGRSLRSWFLGRSKQRDADRWHQGRRGPRGVWVRRFDDGMSGDKAAPVGVHPPNHGCDHDGSQNHQHRRPQMSETLIGAHLGMIIIASHDCYLLLCRLVTTAILFKPSRLLMKRITPPTGSRSAQPGVSCGSYRRPSAATRAPSTACPLRPGPERVRDRETAVPRFGQGAKGASKTRSHPRYRENRRRWGDKSGINLGH